jgi:hypothetical protein
MAFHYVLNFTDYSGVKFNLPNYQKYTVEVLGATLDLLLSKIIIIDQDLPRAGGGGARSFSGVQIAPLKKILAQTLTS